MAIRNDEPFKRKAETFDHGILEWASYSIQLSSKIQAVQKHPPFALYNFRQATEPLSLLSLSQPSSSVEAAPSEEAGSIRGLILLSKHGKPLLSAMHSDPIETGE